MTRPAKLIELRQHVVKKNVCAMSKMVFAGANIQIKLEPPTGIEIPVLVTRMILRQ